jgi:hypothetical protein
MMHGGKIGRYLEIWNASLSAVYTVI